MLVRRYKPFDYLVHSKNQHVEELWATSKFCQKFVDLRIFRPLESDKKKKKVQQKCRVQRLEVLRMCSLHWKNHKRTVDTMQ